MTLGWEHPGEFERLAEWARRCDGPFLEIGSYCGRSTVHLAMAAREQNTVVFACDHHRGSPEMAEGREGFRQEVQVDGRHDTLPHFRHNLAHLEEWTVPVVTSSRTLGVHWAIPLGFLFIDGDHSTEMAVADYRDFEGWVRPDGYLAFHDSDDLGPRTAIEEAIAEGWVVVDKFESLTVLQRKD